MCIVSIHAPLRKGERPSTHGLTAPKPKFQSTLPSEKESDERRWHCGKCQRVSIHAPLRKGERLASGEHDHRRTISFNPRSPPKRRATTSESSRRCSTRRFNPRSPPKRRATALDGIECLTEGVSIHAPLRKGERLPTERRLSAVTGFNPRSPPKRRATTNGTSLIFTSSGFNPRSPPKRRATERQADASHDGCSFNPRSPPKRRATRDRVFGRFMVRVSIHAPLRKGERPGPNPGGSKLNSVSIHAPLRKGERLMRLSWRGGA